MPQMSPMWWELLMTSFMTAFMMVNVMMYWDKENKPAKSMKSIKMNKLNWKW